MHKQKCHKEETKIHFFSSLDTFCNSFCGILGSSFQWKGWGPTTGGRGKVRVATGASTHSTHALLLGKSMQPIILWIEFLILFFGELIQKEYVAE